MELNLKNYKVIKTQKYLKATKLYLFFNGINQNAQNLIQIEQELAAKNITFLKVSNKISQKILQTSIYKNIKPIVSNLSVFVKLKNDRVLLGKKSFDYKLFNFLAIKINTNIYSINQVKLFNSLVYRTNNLILYQFMLTNIKLFFSK